MFARHFRLLACVVASLFCLAAAVAQASTFKLAAFGDSLMDGYGLADGEGFVPVMQERLGNSVEVSDFAVSGDTTADGLTRISRILDSKPDGVLLALGSNDALRHINPAATKENLDAMLDKFSGAGIPVLLVGAQAPLNWGLAYKRNFDNIYEDLADSHDLPLYPFILDGVALVPSLNLADGVHPNKSGIKVMVDKMAPLVMEFIDQAQAR